MVKVGGRQGRENIMAALMGSVAAVIGDFVWNSLQLPGNDEPSALKFVTNGDIYQMTGAAALTGLGFAQGCSRIAPFGYGAFGTQVVTKVILPAFNLPRYLLFDIDKRGRLVPEKRFT